MDKIAKIQKEIGVMSKDKENPFFHSSYFDINSLLAQLQPLLEKHKLVIVQPLTNINERPAISTDVHDTENGKILIETTMPLPDLENPQKMGSAITYYRRYALQSLFMLQTEDDDDGNKASSKKKVGKKAYEAKNEADYQAGKNPLLDNDLDL